MVKYAGITHWQVTEQTADTSRIMLFPETGRSHQLRVHLQWIKHPICGDEFYAFKDALNYSERLCLHAQTLSFTHPVSNQAMAFEIPSPF